MPVQNNYTFDKRQLLKKSIFPIKPLIDLSDVSSVSKSFVGSPWDNVEYDTCEGKQLKNMSCLKINVRSMGGLKLQKDKTSDLSERKV